MQQLYATGSLTRTDGVQTPPPGKGLRLPAVTAATGGLKADLVHSVLPHALYTPPAGGADRLPVRLALLNTPTGRVLTHAVPTGESYFAHTLVNLPDTADAQLAIQTWGSPLWQQSAPESAGDLPELPYLPVADVLDDAAVKDWLGNPAHRELLEFALTALLGTPADRRVFLAAPADDVAKVIYAVTRALPGSLLEAFTFSTFEADPLASTARLVGCECGDGHDLPDACYRTGSTFNTTTGKRSDLRAEVPFAGFAAGTLASGEFAPLDDLKATWQRLGLTDAKQFDLVYRIARGTGPLTKSEAADALQHPPLAAWLAVRADVLTQFLEWALDDRGFANQSFVRAVQAVRQKPDVLAKLADTVRDAGVNAIVAGDKTSASTALEVVLPMASPAKANAVWGELQTVVADPAALSWEMRWHLLPRFVRFRQQQKQAAGVDPAFARWLDVPTDRLGELLGLDLPKAYQLEACRACLRRDGEPTADLTATLARHPHLVLTLLQPADGDERAVKLFESLLAEAPAKPWFEDVIAAAADYPTPLLNKFFEATLAASKLDADRLVRTQGGRLLDLFAGQSGLDRLGTQFLAVPPADVLNNHTVLAFLDKLREQPNLSAELTARIDAVKAVRAYLDSPQFTPEGMAPVAAAFAVTPPALPPTAKQDVFAAVSTELTKRADSPTLQADLEAVLTHLGGTLATDPTDLFENLLRDVRGRMPEFGRRANAVHTFLGVALGATDTPELAGKLTGLDGHAFAVAADAAKKGGNRLLDSIDGRAKAWPADARTKWGFLLAAVRPRSRWLRDVACGLIGAAITAAVWVALRFVG